MIEIEVRLEDANSRPGELMVAVNDAGMGQPLDLTAGGEGWSIVEVSVPVEALAVGNNQIVATAIDSSGNADGRATILLGDITITPKGAALDSVVGSDSEPDAAIVDEETQSPDFGQSEPTIAPR